MNSKQNRQQGFSLPCCWDINNLIAMVKGEDTLLFYYDENGNATSFSHNGTMYFYIKNLQGDNVNIVDSNGNVKVRYDYDVFGKITAIHKDENDITNIDLLNSLRYRGYVYDDETGLYYLQSRYYDPVTGRFLNADVYADTGSGSPLSTNMFAYCENNQLYRIDFNGQKSYTYWSRIKYDRKKAVQYALKWAYGINQIYYDYGKNDCTNFVSQCLHAGGIQYTERPNKKSGWYSYRLGMKTFYPFFVYYKYKFN